MMKKLRLGVTVVIVIFALLALFSWVHGYLLTGTTPAEQSAAQRKAAKEGLFNTGKPIIH